MVYLNFTTLHYEPYNDPEQLLNKVIALEGYVCCFLFDWTLRKFNSNKLCNMESELYPYNQSPSLIRKLCKVLCEV
jgi:hypothetical protein